MTCHISLGSTNIVATCSAFKEAVVSSVPLLLSKMTKPLSSFLTLMNLRLSYEAQGIGLKLRSCKEGWRTHLVSLNNVKNFTFNVRCSDLYHTIEFCSSKNSCVYHFDFKRKAHRLNVKDCKRHSTFFSTPRWSCIRGHTFLLCQSNWWLQNISNYMGIMWSLFFIAHPYLRGIWKGL